LEKPPTSTVERVMQCAQAIQRNNTRLRLNSAFPLLKVGANGIANLFDSARDIRTMCWPDGAIINSVFIF
jgi:hypothetical protein